MLSITGVAVLCVYCCVCVCYMIYSVRMVCDVIWFEMIILHIHEFMVRDSYVPQTAFLHHTLWKCCCGSMFYANLLFSILLQLQPMDKLSVESSANVPLGVIQAIYSSKLYCAIVLLIVPPSVIQHCYVSTTVCGLLLVLLVCCA